MANKPAAKPKAPTRRRGAVARKLPKEIQREVVIRLACYEQPADVHRWLTQELEYDIARQAVLFYNPYSYNGTSSQEWKDLFDKTRADLLNDIVKVPIASRTYRLRQLQTMLDRAMNEDKPTTALSILMQAKDELAAIDPQSDAAGMPAGLPPGELRNMLSDKLAASLDRMKPTTMQ